MRIIAGIARGRTLISPKGRQTRPTQDYVRESLFNIIQRDVPGAAVLDLFAGTGALALEALSRGADSAVLVDSSRLAIECIRRNVDTLGFSRQACVLQGDWRTVLDKTLAPDARFDLVFLDPPYQLTKYAEMTDVLARKGLLAEDALLVIEHRRDAAVTLSATFTLKDCRTYGDTVIHLATFHAGGIDNGE